LAEKKLREQLRVYTIAYPDGVGSIWSPNKVGNFSIELDTSSIADASRFSDDSRLTITVSHMETVEKLEGSQRLQVVFNSIIKELTRQTGYQRLGRRSHKETEVKGNERAQLEIYNGFYASLYTMNSYGLFMVFEVVPRVLHKRSLFDSIEQEYELSDTQEEKNEEWVRRCQGAIVATSYNSRLYRVKRVRFDKTPKNSFTYKDREGGDKEMTFIQFYELFYKSEITKEDQPLLEAYPEQASEEIFLVPEFCQITGFTDDLRKDRNLFLEAIKAAKVSPEERFADDEPCRTAFFSKFRDTTDGNPPTEEDVPDCLKEWKLTLSKTPEEVQAHVLPSLQVKFGNSAHAIEEGNFQRWMRNGLEHPISLEDWLLVYPESDAPVIDIWLRSLKDIAQVAFTMKMPDPRRVVCSDQVEHLVQTLENNMLPKTKMVLLLAQQKDFKKVYSICKKYTLCEKGCVTQVVRSETIRKRQSIASVLSRIVLQINAKCDGALWHITLKEKDTRPFYDQPNSTMCIGIDVYHAPMTNADGENLKDNMKECTTPWIGLVASIDDHATKYYSKAFKLEWRPSESGALELNASSVIKAFLPEALFHFRNTAWNAGQQLPEHFLVYRNSVEPYEWEHIHATEVSAIKSILEHFSTQVREKFGVAYNPGLTFVAIRRREHSRFCLKDGKKNPPPGTVIDAPQLALPGLENFLLVNQAVSKGVACPTHYTILEKAEGVEKWALQNLTYRLSFLYFNYTGSVRLPAPAQYAKKLAYLHGAAVQPTQEKPIRDMLAESLYYL